MLVATILLTLSNLGKGGPGKPSIFGFKRCSLLSFGWFFFCLILVCLTSLFGYFAYKKDEKNKEEIEEMLIEKGEILEKSNFQVYLKINFYQLKRKN